MSIPQNSAQTHNPQRPPAGVWLAAASLVFAALVVAGLASPLSSSLDGLTRYGSEPPGITNYIPALWYGSAGLHLLSALLVVLRPARTQVLVAVLSIPGILCSGYSVATGFKHSSLIGFPAPTFIYLGFFGVLFVVLAGINLGKSNVRAWLAPGSGGESESGT
ncbi:hypothetical protein RIF23_14975 [Lipingzhangella sp. LS1_29]|uniref:Uncharacterized protein n=1 Tax=Lipingzhangella rawalii TaxID=2055835 RepID=A0ABU2H8H7_9ACTN|nr:hypothetical protein [Lipingzhangella rawalii]MDS1271596.1 hypothetical protein [Lipingzhangella rawalii]